MPRAVPASRVAYWKEREARWQAFAQKNGADYMAFAKVEKPFATKQRAREKAEKSGRKRPLSIPTATAASCAGGEKPKVVFGTPRCVPEESVMSDIVDRMRTLAGITPAYPEMDRPEAALDEAETQLWDELSKHLDPVIEIAKKILQGRSGHDQSVKRLLNAAVEVRKSWDGD